MTGNCAECVEKMGKGGEVDGEEGGWGVERKGGFCEDRR